MGWKKETESKKKRKMSFLKSKELQIYIRVGLFILILGIVFSIANAIIMLDLGYGDIPILIFVSIFYVIFFIILIGGQILFLYETRGTSLLKYVIIPIILIYGFSSYFFFMKYCTEKSNFWFYEMSLAIFVVNFMSILGIYKLCEACNELFSDKFTPTRRKERKHLLYVRWALPAFIGFIYALFILFILIPDLSAGGFSTQDNSYLLSQVTILIILVGLARYFIGLVLEIEDVDDISWKKVTKIVFFPIVSFGIYEVYSAVTGGRVFLNIRISPIFHEVFVYGVIFVMAILSYYLFIVIKNVLKSLLEYLYDESYKK